MSESASAREESDAQFAETKSGAIVRAFVERHLAADRTFYREGIPLMEVEGLGVVYAEQVENALTEVLEQGGVHECSDESGLHPSCAGDCERPAVVRGLDVVDGEVVPKTPFCSECFTRASEVELPEGVERDEVLDAHSDSLIVTPADTVVQDGEETVIEHGPGSQSRVVLG